MLKILPCKDYFRPDRFWEYQNAWHHQKRIYKVISWNKYKRVEYQTGTNRMLVWPNTQWYDLGRMFRQRIVSLITVYDGGKKNGNKLFWNFHQINTSTKMNNSLLHETVNQNILYCSTGKILWNTWYVM